MIKLNLTDIKEDELNKLAPAGIYVVELTTEPTLRRSRAGFLYLNQGAKLVEKYQHVGNIFGSIHLEGPQQFTAVNFLKGLGYTMNEIATFEVNERAQLSNEVWSVPVELKINGEAFTVTGKQTKAKVRRKFSKREGCDVNDIFGFLA